MSAVHNKHMTLGLNQDKLSVNSITNSNHSFPLVYPAYLDAVRAKVGEVVSTIAV